MGKREHLGELEEIILMITGSLGDSAYAVSVMDELSSQAGRAINVSAVHAVLKRLEKKGYVSSHVGGSTKERGGRSKRIYVITSEGKNVLKSSMRMKLDLYNRIPGFNLSFLGR